MQRIARLYTTTVYALIRTFAHITLALYVDLHVEGADHIPPTGAVVIASRHYHFLFDALAQLHTLPRPVRIWVAVDWTSARWQRLGMELLCRSAGWPIALRIDEFSAPRFDLGQTAYTVKEAGPMLREATRRAITLLREDEVLLIFPEAYTNIDIFPTPKDDANAFMPFRPGFVKLAQLAGRDGTSLTSIVPAGLSYERLAPTRHPAWLPSIRPLWRVTLRFGERLEVPPHATKRETATLISQIERDIHVLSEPISVAPTSVMSRESER